MDNDFGLVGSHFSCKDWLVHASRKERMGVS
jgi:hypothetical protein